MKFRFSIKAFQRAGADVCSDPDPDSGLVALFLPAVVTRGEVIPIGAATDGSSISALILPTGWTVDGPGRTITIAPDAPVATVNWTLVEILADASRTTSGSTAVLPVEVSPPLTALSLPATANPGDVLAIGGATDGSTIEATLLPEGWSLDGPNRQITIAPEAAPGAQSWVFVETLEGRPNTPNPSGGTTVIEAVNQVILERLPDGRVRVVSLPEVEEITTTRLPNGNIQIEASA